MTYFKIDSIEKGVNYLVKDANGWEHPYLREKFTNFDKCLLCNESEESHNDLNYSEKQIEDEKEIKIEVCEICYN